MTVVGVQINRKEEESITMYVVYSLSADNVENDVSTVLSWIIAILPQSHNLHVRCKQKQICFP